jgi:exopolyphosphatase/guanosine-5'-triphosphate,3'-diphosphate pyrophosphatase
MGCLSTGLVAQGLDLGSNTFSYCELVADELGVPRLRRDVSVPVRLSEGLSPGGRLRPAAIARGLAVLESYKEHQGLDSSRLRAVGTAVFRLCAFAEDFIAPASELLGVPVEILSGEQEARLTYAGATLGLTKTSEEGWVMLDIGGQSTEMGWRAEDRLEFLSLPLGVVALSEAHLCSDPPELSQIEALRAEVKSRLGQQIPGHLRGTLLCVAGTATTLGHIALELSSWHRERLHGLSLSREVLHGWLEKILAISAKERTSRYGISPGRADVFPAGLMLLDEVLGHLNKTDFTISASGLRVGAALSVFEDGEVLR